MQRSQMNAIGELFVRAGFPGLPLPGRSQGAAACPEGRLLLMEDLKPHSASRRAATCIHKTFAWCVILELGLMRDGKLLQLQQSSSNTWAHYEAIPTVESTYMGFLLPIYMHAEKPI